MASESNSILVDRDDSHRDDSQTCAHLGPPRDSLVQSLVSPRAGAAAPTIPEMIYKSAATTEITIVPLRRNISVLMGSGGNITVLPGADGKLMIDAGIAASKKRVAAALASISSDPLKQLVSSHWHFDHTDGNDWIHSEGAAILSHANTRKRLLVRHRVEGWHFTFPAAPKGGLPTTVFQKNLRLYMNDATVELDYYEPAHTDSDISAHFIEADVIHVSDTWWNGVYPFIDYSSGGNIDGTIEAVATNLAKVTDNTIIIPGHGAVGNKADMQNYYDMLATVRERVSALKEKGLSLSETIAERPTADFDDEWGKFVIKPPLFTELVYTGV